jgi:hypothetical protein
MGQHARTVAGKTSNAKLQTPKNTPSLAHSAIHRTQYLKFGNESAFRLSSAPLLWRVGFVIWDFSS